MPGYNQKRPAPEQGVGLFVFTPKNRAENISDPANRFRGGPPLIFQGAVVIRPRKEK